MVAILAIDISQPTPEPEKSLRQVGSFSKVNRFYTIISVTKYHHLLRSLIQWMMAEVSQSNGHAIFTLYKAYVFQQFGDTRKNDMRYSVFLYLYAICFVHRIYSFMDSQ